MSHYTVTVNEIDILGRLWLPMCKAGQTIKLDRYDIENIKQEDGNITRDSVQNWLDCNAGDFSSIIDFHVDIGDIDIPWNSEENEMEFLDLMFPSEDD